MPESIHMKKENLTILTVREVAEYLRMSETKIYQLVKERRIPAVRIGKSWRFRKDLLDDWLIQCTEPSVEEIELPGAPVKRPAPDDYSKG